MDADTVRRLNDLNRQFYAQTAEYFHASRDQAWTGWERLVAFLPEQRPLRVLDVGCGNGRFGLFLHEHLGDGLIYHGVDNSPALLDYAATSLAPHIPALTLSEQDIVFDALPDGEFDVVACFGVIHHVPSLAHRRALLETLAEHTAPQGLLAFAAWRFYDQPRFRERIVPWGEEWQVEHHDYLLDWQRGTTALRYCHFVDDAEHAALIAATGLHELLTYRADGRTADLNQYSLLRRA